MHDIRAIRETPELYETAWAAKGRSGAAAQAVDLDAKLRAAKLALETAQSRRNEASKLIGQAKAKKDEAEAQRLMAEVEQVKGVLAEQAEVERAVSADECGGAGQAVAGEVVVEVPERMFQRTEDLDKVCGIR